MTTAYTPILQLALPVTGELDGTWGTVVNDNITSMIEQAIAGLATINTWTTASHTLTTADGTTDEARCAVLQCSGAPGAAATVICPASTKLYVIKNSVTGGYAVTLKTSAGTGISVPNGSTALLYCDGTNVVSGATYMATLVTTSITDSGLTSGRVTYAGAGGLLQDAAALTFDGTTLSSTKFAGALDGTVGATTPTTVVATQVDITAQGDLRLQDTTGGQYVALQAPGTVAASYTLTLPVDDGTAGQALVTDGSGVLSWSTAASGDVYGPASATDNAVARFDGTTGKLIQDSVVTIADTTGNMAGVGTFSSGAITSSALTSGRVPYAGTAGLIQDSANLTFDGSTLTNTGRITTGTGVGAGSSATQITIGGTLASASNVTRAVSNIGTAPSTSTTEFSSYISAPSTTAAAYTITTLNHFIASFATLGATSAITNQFGHVAASTLTGATNNYGFYGNIASGTNRFNFYANGTAANVFAGTTSLGGLVGAEALRATRVASAVNYLDVSGAIATASPSLAAAGSDTNIDITLTPKGTGVLKFGTYTAGILAQAGYITIKDAAGNTRNLLVG